MRRRILLGCFAEQWKVAQIVVILKSPKEVKKYRPIIPKDKF